MGRRGVFLLLAVALVLTLGSGVDAAKKSKSPKTVVTGSEKLTELQGRVRDGVVPFTSELYEKFVLRPDRPYHLFLMFTAMAEKFKCEVCQYVPALVLGSRTDC